MTSAIIRTGSGVRVVIDASQVAEALEPRFDSIDAQLAEILALLESGGTPTPTPGGGAFDFSNPINSGLAAVLAF